MANFLEIFRALTRPEQLIELLRTVFSGGWGYALLAGIVFAETGLLVGFFLPGDSLLFTVGVVAGAGELNLALINLTLMGAVICGDNVGYFLGRRTGQGIFQRQDSLLFRQQHVTKTQAFFSRHGGKAIVYARFVPIVRTFTPFMAGVGRMPYSRFLTYSIFGGIGWVAAMTLLGYTLGNVPIVRQHFEKVILLIIFLSVLPVILELLKSRRKEGVEVA